MTEKIMLRMANTPVFRRLLGLHKLSSRISDHLEDKKIEKITPNSIHWCEGEKMRAVFFTRPRFQEAYNRYFGCLSLFKYAAILGSKGMLAPLVAGTNFTTTVNDGVVTGTENATWATVHDAAAGGSVDTTDLVAGGYLVSSKYNIYRCYTPFDTSSIGAGATVSAATVYGYATLVNDSDNDGKDWINVVQATPATPGGALVTADYDQIGSVTNPTEGSTRIDLGDVSVPNWYSWALDATGLTWVSKTGYTEIGWREGHDALNEAYSAINNTRIRFQASEGGANDAYLDVTYGTGIKASFLTKMV